MPLVLTRAPAVEPVSVAEAKAHCRIDGTSEDALIAALIETSRLQVEAALSLALISQDWRLSLDDWPTEVVVLLPIHPVLAVGDIAITDAEGATSLIPPSARTVDLASRPARIRPREGSWARPGAAMAGISIAFTAGFGTEPSHVPAPLRQAVRLLVAHWYETREPTPVALTPPALPGEVSALLAPFREARL